MNLSLISLISLLVLCYCNRAEADGKFVNQCNVCKGYTGSLIDANRRCNVSNLVVATCDNSKHCLFSEKPIASAIISSLREIVKTLSLSRPLFTDIKGKGQLYCSIKWIRNFRKTLVNAVTPKCATLRKLLVAAKKQYYSPNASGVFICDSDSWRFGEAMVHFGDWLWRASKIQEHCFDNETATNDYDFLDNLSNEEFENIIKNIVQDQSRPKRSADDVVYIDTDCWNNQETFAPFVDLKVDKSRRSAENSTTTTTTTTTSSTTTTTSTTDVLPVFNPRQPLSTNDSDYFIDYNDYIDYNESQTVGPSEADMANSLCKSTVCWRMEQRLKKLQLIRSEAGLGCITHRACILNIIESVDFGTGDYDVCSWTSCNHRTNREVGKSIIQDKFERPRSHSDKTSQDGSRNTEYKILSKTITANTTTASSGQQILAFRSLLLTLIFILEIVL